MPTPHTTDATPAVSLALVRPWPATFPWRQDNRFELLVDGTEFFPAMLDAINAAHTYVLLELYLFSSGHIADQFIEALLRAAQRGPIVRVMLDDFGALQLHTKDRQRLIAGGVDVVFYNQLSWHKGLRNLLRNHRKLLVVDGTVAFTGGVGVSDEFNATPNHSHHWHEAVIKIQGPVVTDWQLLFERTWNRITRSFKHAYTALPVIPTPNWSTPGQLGRVTASNGPNAHFIMQSLMRQIQRARTKVWLVTPYFMPSWKLRRHLISAARHGIDVRILVPGPHTDHPALRQASRRLFSRLLRNHVRIFEYQPRFIHAKIALCDQWSSIGSTNFDRWNFYWNLDANQEVEDSALAAQITSMLEKDFLDSHELQLEHWQQRAWWLRVLEHLTGLLDRWLSQLSIKRKH